MDWTEAISKAVQYIEDNIIEDISAEDVANHVNISAYYSRKDLAFFVDIQLQNISVTEGWLLQQGKLHQEI